MEHDRILQRRNLASSRFWDDAAEAEFRSRMRHVIPAARQVRSDALRFAGWELPRSAFSRIKKSNVNRNKRKGEIAECATAQRKRGGGLHVFTDAALQYLMPF